MVPLTLDDTFCANYGELEWRVLPPGPVCVQGEDEDWNWGWPAVAAGLLLTAPLLVTWYRHPGRREPDGAS